MSSTPKKGEIIINPKTSRPVKVGCRTWLKLVKDGLVEGRYNDPNELYEVKEPSETADKIEELNKTLPRGQHAVRGRGKYANKIVRRQKQPNPQELTEYTAKTAARTIAKNVDKLDTYEDLESQLEKMILEEMMIGEPRAVRPKPNHKNMMSKNMMIMNMMKMYLLTRMKMNFMNINKLLFYILYYIVYINKDDDS